MELLNPLVLELFDDEELLVEDEVPGNDLVVLLVLLDLELEKLDLDFELPKDLEKDDLLPEDLNPFAEIPIVEVNIKIKTKKTANIFLFTKIDLQRLPLITLCVLINLKKCYCLKLYIL